MTPVPDPGFFFKLYPVFLDDQIRFFVLEDPDPSKHQPEPWFRAGRLKRVYGTLEFFSNDF